MQLHIQINNKVTKLNKPNKILQQNFQTLKFLNLIWQWRTNNDRGLPEWWWGCFTDDVIGHEQLLQSRAAALSHYLDLNLKLLLLLLWLYGAMDVEKTKVEEDEG